MQPQCLCSPTPPTSSFTLTFTPTIFRVFVLFVLCYKHSKKKKKKNLGDWHKNEMEKFTALFLQRYGLGFIEARSPVYRTKQHMLG